MALSTVPYVSGSATSRAAAAAVAPHLADKERLVYEALLESGAYGLTTDECEVITGMRHQSCSARIVELNRRGLIGKTQRKRATRSGPNYLAFVYVVI